MVFSTLGERLNIRAAAADQVDKTLSQAAHYIDDEHWCEQVAASLGLDKLLLRKSCHSRFPIEIVVPSGTSIATDPWIPSLIRLALTYTKSPFRLRSGDDLVAITLGRTVAASVSGLPDESLDLLTATVLDRLEQEGRGLTSMFMNEHAAGTT